MTTKRITRSCSMHASTNDDANTNDDLNELNAILAPIKKNILDTNKMLEDITKLYEIFFLMQKREILNLQTRIRNLEEKMSYQEYVTDLHDRKLDDLEQVSRKVNLRLKGIIIARGDSPHKLMDLITTEIQTLELGIPDEELDRCHRVGKPYFRNRNRCQDVLVKFRTWRSRDIMYQNRKKFSFLVVADLTPRRENLLKFVKEQCITDDGEPTVVAVNRVVDFAFCDKNCKIKFKSMSDRFYTVSSENEFLKLVNQLDQDLTVSDDFKSDERNRGNYNIFEEEVNACEIYY